MHNFIIQTGSEVLGSLEGGSSTLAFAGIGSWIAIPFMAENNWIINRVATYHGTLTSGTAYTYLIGIGTWDNEKGRPSTVGGFGRTLEFLSFAQSPATKTNSVFPFYAIPSLQLTAGTKYFIGLGITQATGTFNHAMVIQGGNAPYHPWNYSGIYTLGGGINTQNIRSEWTTFNWGYDSGNGITEWYNKQYAGVTPARQTLRVTSNTYQKLMSICFNTDFQSIYLDTVQWHIDTLTSNVFPAGSGVTYFVTLWDTDGTTALTSYSKSVYGSRNNSNSFTAHFPVKYWIQNKKVYYLGIGTTGQTDTGSENAIGTVTVNSNMHNFPGNAFTSVYCTKSTLAGAITRVPATHVISSLSVYFANGSRQGGIGNV